MCEEHARSLKQLLGGLVFASPRPLGIKEMRRCLAEVGAEGGREAAVFGEATPSQLREALEELRSDLERTGGGFSLAEVSGGYQLQSDPDCGPWVRHLLAAGRPQRLSQPALETLAIIAYRQPVTRADIEAVRGVQVDHVVRMLMEMQLVKITGRSELPGRPFLYGTTQAFLEHFGLRSLEELSDMDPALLSEPPERGSGAAAGPSAEEEGEKGNQGEECGDEP